MGFYIPTVDDWRRTASRKLVMGEPNSGKTTSLMTLPPYMRPAHVISCPGELGSNSIPREEGIIPHIWQETPEDKLDSKSVLNQVRQLTVDILSKKFGEVNTIVVDGLHKLGYYHLDAASGGTWFAGKDFDIKREFGKVDPYSKSYSSFDNYMKLIWESDIPHAIFTCWDGKEPGKFAGVEVKGGRVYPGLHGQLAKKLLGMFSFVLYAEKTWVLKIGKYVPAFQWRLKESQEVAGAVVKLPPSLVAQLPETLEQDWHKLNELLEKLGAI